MPVHEQRSQRRSGSGRTTSALVAVATMISACAGGSSAPAVTPPMTPMTPILTPSAAAATTSVAREVGNPASSRVLLIGDSTLLAVESYRAFTALRGFAYTFDAKSCRTLGVPSCGDPPVPQNTVGAIEAAAGAFGTVVVMAGYDEWWTSFPNSFDLVMEAARAKGATRTVWLTYREGVGYRLPDGSDANEAFMRNNATLRAKLASGEYPDAVLADWFAYSARAQTWLFRDGIHLTPTGALGVADYISRVLAHLDGRACPKPWSSGQGIDAVCPDPDLRDTVADVEALYP